MGNEFNGIKPVTVMDVELSDGTHLIFDKQTNGELQIPAAPILNDEQIAEARTAIQFQQDSESTGFAANQALNNLIKRQDIYSFILGGLRNFQRYKDLKINGELIKYKKINNYSTIKELPKYYSSRIADRVLLELLEEPSTKKDPKLMRLIKEMLDGAAHMNLETK